MLRKLLISAIILAAWAGIVLAQATPAPSPTSSLNQDVNGNNTGQPGILGNQQFLGYMTTVITPAVAPPGGAPSWSEVFLPDDGSESAAVTFTVPTTQTSPTNYTLLVNGRCIVNTGTGACQQPSVPVSYVCTGPGIFQINFQATGYISIPKSIACVPPTQVPGATGVTAPAPGTGAGTR